MNEKSHWKEEKEGPGEMVFYVWQPNTQDSRGMEAASRGQEGLGQRGPTASIDTRADADLV